MKTTSETEQVPIDDLLEEKWKQITECAKDVSRLYKDFVKASDTLADAMGYDEDWILRRVLPEASNRRDYTHVKTIIEYEKENWRKEEGKQIEDDRFQTKREVILKRLNLSDEEKVVLGIKD